MLRIAFWIGIEQLWCSRPGEFPNVTIPNGTFLTLPRWMESRLDAAPDAVSSLHTAAGQPMTTIDVGEAAVAQWKVVGLPEFAQPLRRLHRQRTRKLADPLLDALVRAVLPHVSLDGRPVAFEDVYYVSFGLQSGASFPSVHWDTTWHGFQGVPGFQVWYMVKPSPAAWRSTGNLYVLSASTLHAKDPPCYYRVNGNGKVVKIQYNPGRHLARYMSVDHAGLAFHYLNFSVGEAVIFSKRTLHGMLHTVAALWPPPLPRAPCSRSAVPRPASRAT